MLAHEAQGRRVETASLMGFSGAQGLLLAHEEIIFHLALARHLRGPRMARRIALIMNPAARSTKAARMLSRVQALRPAPDIHLTRQVGHAGDLAERLAEDGADVVVAVGGDGTVNEVLQGVCRANARRADPASHTAIGTLPAGTMNVFAYELGFQTHTDFTTPWHFISSGHEHQLDLWMANDSYFLQLAGVGMDAEIVRLTTWEQKKRLGPLSYIFSAWKVLRRRLPLLTLEIEGRPPLRGCMALIGNGKHYGGPFPIFPHASNTDGQLDVLWFRESEVNVWQALQMLKGVITGGYREFEDLDFTIRSDTPTALELDGELAGRTPVTFRKAAFPLRVAAPCPQASAREIAALLQHPVTTAAS
jgi:diacylglycerol kinase (ATP)